MSKLYVYIQICQSKVFHVFIELRFVVTKNIKGAFSWKIVIFWTLYKAKYFFKPLSYLHRILILTGEQLNSLKQPARISTTFIRTQPKWRPWRLDLDLITSTSGLRLLCGCMWIGVKVQEQPIDQWSTEWRTASGGCIGSLQRSQHSKNTKCVSNEIFIGNINITSSSLYVKQFMIQEMTFCFHVCIQKKTLEHFIGRLESNLPFDIF